MPEMLRKKANQPKSTAKEMLKRVNSKNTKRRCFKLSEFEIPYTSARNA